MGWTYAASLSEEWQSSERIDHTVQNDTYETLILDLFFNIIGYICSASQTLLFDLRYIHLCFCQANSRPTALSSQKKTDTG